MLNDAPVSLEMAADEAPKQQRGPVTDHPARRSSATERMRRHRERRRDGLRCLTIELRETEVQTLISRGILESGKRKDLDAIRSAPYEFLDSALGEMS
jgi:hypothetical protein